MVTQKDGKEVNPSPVCQVPKCGNESAVRLTEVPEFATSRNPLRRDLCKGHAYQTLRAYEDKVEVIAVWNGEDMDDWDDG